LLVVDPQTPTTLYAGFGGFRNVFGSGRLYKSVDGGSDWVPAMEGLTSVAALAIDPQVTSTIYAGSGREVFKSTNGGGSWSPSSTGLSAQDVVALAVHPDAPSIVFAGTYGGGVFRSTDNGASWSSMDKQPPNLRVRALAINARSDTLYAGTDGAGVFAIAAPAQFPLTVTTTGHGFSTIISSPTGIDCGSNCTAMFPVGTTIALTATAARGVIRDWSGCDSDTGRGRTSTCTVTIDATRTVTATVGGGRKVLPDHHQPPGRPSR
jgi:hypothetical protein